MFQVKICGITTVEDALLAAEAGTDGIGLNFVEGSPRCIFGGRAVDIIETLDRAGYGAIWIVGVHANENVERLMLNFAFNWQLHGDELPEIVAELRRGLPEDESRLPEAAFRTIKAFRVTNGDLGPVREYLETCQRLGGMPHGVLLDAHQPGVYGGTGRKLDWNMVREQRDKLMGLPLILAGGLTPENVAEAIETARPDAVDVSSGVESSPGRKDPEKVRAFVAAAKKAFEGLDR